MTVKKACHLISETKSGSSLAPNWRQVMRAVSRPGLVLVLVLMIAQAGFAIPLHEYRSRVKSAIHSLELIGSDETQAQVNKEPLVQVNLRGAREALPRKEIVEWNETKFIVDNSWLDDQLKEFERSGVSESDRLAALARTIEQLKALDERLDEIYKASSASSPSKAELRGRLASILQRPEYVRAAKEETALARLMKWLIKWITSLFPERRSISPGRASAISRLAQIFVIVVALAAIGYAVWMFAPRFMRRRKIKKPAKPRARVVLGERLEPDQSAADLLAEAEALARNGDLRGAIRRGYIALLIELADRKLISLAQYKTNRDYLRSVREIRNLHRNMEVLTNNFEQHWYGLVPVDEKDWVAFRAGYKEAITSA